MKNGWIRKLKGRMKLKITGKNTERFIKKLHAHHIELLQITYLKRNQVVIEIYKQDYEQVLELKTVYEIALVDTLGSLQIKRKLSMNFIFLMALSFGIVLLLFLSNIMYRVEIVHTNKEIRTLLLNELEEYGIKEKSFKKSFQKLEKIKAEIVNKHRDKIEWLEIETVGTKYVVRVEIRKIVVPEEQTELQNIIATKGAIIRKVEARSGEIIRNTNDYVNAGDVVISGEIKLGEEAVNYTRAEGKVYGEVWYKTTVTYPFYYYEERTTEKKKKVLVLQIGSYKWELFGGKPYEHKKVNSKPILTHLFLPLSLSIEKQEEVQINEEMNTEEEAIDKATKYAYEKMKSQLSDKEEIINQKNLKVTIKNSTIVIDTFFTVLEDITGFQKIEKREINEAEKIEENR